MTMIRIVVDTMTVEAGDRVVATARVSGHAVADGNGARVVSAHPARLLIRGQAVTALTVAGLGECPGGHRLMAALHVELG
jgi:hypothetical protein